jgi:hypothetical protein
MNTQQSSLTSVDKAILEIPRRMRSTAILVDGGFYTRRANRLLGEVVTIRPQLKEHVDGVRTCLPRVLKDTRLPVTASGVEPSSVDDLSSDDLVP